MEHVYRRRARMSARIAPALVLTCLVAGGSLTRLAAQYPLAPTPVLDLSSLSPEPRFSGYVSVRETWRRDTSTFLINRARITIQTRPLAYAAVRIQTDLSAVGQARGDTIPPVTLTDAYVQISPQDTASWLHHLRPALIVGQFRTPFSLEFLTSFSLLPLSNRSQASDRIAKRRDIGVLGQIRVGRVATVTAALVNGEGSNRARNTDGRQTAIGRITVFPARVAQVSAKGLTQSGDRGWGFDARVLAGPLTVEGESLWRHAHSDVTTTACGSGGYALAAYRLTTWLQPAVKWERLHERACTPAAPSVSRLTWMTYGVVVAAPDQRVRFQLNWLVKTARPVDQSNEVVAQLIGIF
jgi:Phosphate-selective porin O and P